MRPRSRNVRRGARSTLVFRIVISSCVFGLLLALVNLAGALKEVREELAAQPKPVAPVVPADSGAEPEVSAEDLVGLQKAVEALRTEVTALQSTRAEELAELRQEANQERDRIEARFKALTELIANQEAEAPPPGDPGAVEVVPPPEDGSEDPSLVPTPPDGVEAGGDPVTPPGGESEAVSTGGDLDTVGDGELEPEFTEYAIRRGDTMSGIAVRFKVDMEELLELNEIDNPSLIRIGQVLKIPK